jgi:dihydroxyacetone kinase-like protein
MYDALLPALEALKAATDNEQSIASALEQAVAAAKQGMEDTIPLQAKKGRASYLGERSIGHQDPGATSSYLLLKALLDTISTEG